MIAAGKAATILALTPNRHKGARRSCALTRNVPACEVLAAPSGSRTTRLRAGSKKLLTILPPLERTLLPARPSEELVLELLDELWSFVRKKADKRWVWLALA
jgi:hypothetical protein